MRVIVLNILFAYSLLLLHVVSCRIVGYVREKVLVGGQALLPCNLTVPPNDDNITLVLWYKGSSQVPIFTYDMRIKPSDKLGRQFVPRKWRDRLSFNIDVKPAVLQIDDVMAGDDSQYRCKIDYHHSKSVTFKIALSVIVPPSAPVITDKQGRTLSGKIGPYKQGERLKLVCSAFDGNPSPYVTWWKDSKNMSTKYFAKQGGVVVNELVIEGLAREDLHKELECQASNNNITKAAKSKVLLELILRPLDVTITSKKRELKANISTNLECESSGSRPPAVITWWKGSEKMTSTETSFLSDSNISRSVLTFTPSANDNGKYISCRADNPSIPESALENGRKLHVNYMPIVESTFRDKSKNVLEESDVFLECRVKANPWIHTIEWFFNDSVLKNSNVATKDSSTWTLMLKKVNRSHLGEYFCAAKNTEGTGFSNKIKLNVKYRPICKEKEAMIIGAGIGEKVPLKCKVDSDPSDVQISWSFKNSTGVHNLKTAHVKSGSHSLRIMPQRMSDYGVFYCSAKNSIGVQKHPCVFKLIHAARPHTPVNCTIFNRTSSSLSVECIAGFNGGLNQIFIMEVYDESGKRLIFNISSEDKPRFTAPGLSSGSLFILAIYSTNLKGDSDKFIINSRTLGNVYFGSDDRLSISINLILGVLIAVAILGILTSVVVMRLLRLKQNSKRKRKEKESKESSRMKKQEVCLPSDTSLTYSDDKNPDIIPNMGSKYGDDCQLFHITPSSDTICTTIKQSPKEYPRNLDATPSSDSFLQEVSLENRYPDVYNKSLRRKDGEYWVCSNTSLKSKAISNDEEDMHPNTPLMSFQCHSESAV